TTLLSSVEPGTARAAVRLARAEPAGTAWGGGGPPVGRRGADPSGPRAPRGLPAPPPPAGPGGRAGAAPPPAPGRAGRGGGGAPLPALVLARMNRIFDWDFAAVRIHVDERAAAAARTLGARALTVGRDIYFAPGEFAPGSVEGDRLLVHELTHVLQHDTGR